MPVTWPKIDPGWKMDPEKFLPLVVVDWADAASGYAAWIPVFEVPTLSLGRCQTVGFLVPHPDPSIVVVAQSIHQHNIGNPIMIPRCWITKVKVVKG